MFNGILASSTRYYLWFTVFAGIGIILAAVYTLNMIRKVFYGDTGIVTAQASDLKLVEQVALGIIVILIFWMGVYPQALLDITQSATQFIVEKTQLTNSLLKK